MVLHYFTLKSSFICGRLASKCADTARTSSSESRSSFYTACMEKENRKIPQWKIQKLDERRGDLQVSNSATLTSPGPCPCTLQLYNKQ